MADQVRGEDKEGGEEGKKEGRQTGCSEGIGCVDRDDGCGCYEGGLAECEGGGHERWGGLVAPVVGEVVP
jgi:hypothetical protein